MRIAAAAVLLAVLAVGCHEDPAPAPGPLTKAEYEQRVRAARADNAPKRARFLATVEASGRADVEKVAATLREFADEVRADRAALDALEPPADIAHEHQRFVGILVAEADAYDCAAQEIQEAADPADTRTTQTEMQLCLQSFYDDEKHYFDGEDFLRVVRRYGYDLGPALRSDVIPDVPHRFLGSE